MPDNSATALAAVSTAISGAFVGLEGLAGFAVAILEARKRLSKITKSVGFVFIGSTSFAKKIRNNNLFLS